jgi:anthranilate phosphoribosyltransferase
MTIDSVGWLRRFAPDGASRDLDRQEAAVLYGAMLDGEVPEPVQGAILVAIARKGESIGEALGFLDALGPRTARLALPSNLPRPVVLPSYSGTLAGPNLTALLALLLARYGVPVLVHGSAAPHDAGAGGAARGVGPDEARRVSTAEVLWELGVEPARSPQDIEERLVRRRIAYAPTPVLSAGLARLLETRARLGVGSPAHLLARIIAPYRGQAVRVVSVADPSELPRMRELVAATEADVMLLVGTEGEPFADPLRCPAIEIYRRGALARTIDADEAPIDPAPRLPAVFDPAALGAWIEGALAGSEPVPRPILQQMGGLLEAVREPAPVARVA